MPHIVRWWWKVGKFCIIIENKLNLAAWNVRTTNDCADSCRPERATAIISRELATANIDICALSEVRCEATGNIAERDHTIN